MIHTKWIAVCIIYRNILNKQHYCKFILEFQSFIHWFHSKSFQIQKSIKNSSINIFFFFIYNVNSWGKNKLYIIWQSRTSFLLWNNEIILCIQYLYASVVVQLMLTDTRLFKYLCCFRRIEEIYGTKLGRPWRKKFHFIQGYRGWCPYISQILIPVFSLPSLLILYKLVYTT